MTHTINRETVLTDDNMGSHDRDSFFMDVCAFIENNSKTGDPFQSLQDWLSNGDYGDTPTVDATIAEWDSERVEEDQIEATNETLDALADAALNN